MTRTDQGSASNAADIAAIVVAYRSAEHLRRGLPALLSDPSVARVIVIDNSADEDTREACAEVEEHLSGRLTYVASANVGFARGCNSGAQLCDEPFLLFINPDVLLERAVGGLKEPLIAGWAAISAGLLITPPDGTNIKPLASPGLELMRSLVGARRSSRTSSAVVDGRWVRAPQLDGAFLLLRRNVWRQLEGFDEQFELYYEDVDLCRRAVFIGGCVADSTEPYGQHEGGASYLRVRSPAYTAMRVSRIRYLRKHYGTPGAACAAVVAVLEWLSRSATRQPEGSRARITGLHAQANELRRPGSVWVLSSADSSR